MMRLLRPNNPEGQELLEYLDAREAVLFKQVAVPLITEREADTLRGRIAELQKLRSAVQNQVIGD